MATSESHKGHEMDNQLREVRSLAKEMQKARTGIVLTGVVRNGKVELDQTTLDEIAQKFGNANTAFVAVNAPFDPQPVVK
jgi:hypothetical protein